MKPIKYQDKFRIPSSRLKGYDYSFPGKYFVTINTKDKIQYLGKIINDVPPRDKPFLGAVETDNCPSLPMPSPPVETDNYPSLPLPSPPVETHNCASLHPPFPPVETDNYPSLRAPFPPEETDNYPSLQTPSHPVETDNCPSLQHGSIVNINSMDNMHQTLNPIMQFSPIGQIAFNFWKGIPKHFPFVSLDEFVIMPNHIHGILIINKIENEIKEWKPNQFGRQSRNLGSIIRAFKSSVKNFANKNKIPLLWQPRFHDRIIRDDAELNQIRNYIIDNPIEWLKKYGNANAGNI